MACLYLSWYVYAPFLKARKQINYATDKPHERIIRICTAMYRKLNEMVKMYKAKLKKDILYCFLIVSCLIKADYTYRDFDCSNCSDFVIHCYEKP